MQTSEKARRNIGDYISYIFKPSLNEGGSGEFELGFIKNPFFKNIIITKGGEEFLNWNSLYFVFPLTFKRKLSFLKKHYCEKTDSYVGIKTVQYNG
jgi:hypothetical protein